MHYDEQQARRRRPASNNKLYRDKDLNTRSRYYDSQELSSMDVREKYREVRPEEISRRLPQVDDEYGTRRKQRPAPNAHSRPGNNMPRRRPGTGGAPRRRRRRRTNFVRPILFLLFIIFLASMVIFISRCGTAEQDYMPVGMILEQPEHTPEEDYDDGMEAVSIFAVHDTGYLKLVNRQHGMSRPTNPADIVTVSPTVPSSGMHVTAHRTLLNAIQAMFATAGDIPFFVTSGYRDIERQREIYETAEDRMYVMPPGHSEHNLGLAADIAVIGINMFNMSGTPEAIWLAENAWIHGMILRYPQGKTHITETAYEPWHFRYVGSIHAWYIHTNEIVLEQYLDFLRAEGGFSARLNNRIYHVSYQRPDIGEIRVPRYLYFNVSSSNLGGFVVTSWEYTDELPAQ